MKKALCKESSTVFSCSEVAEARGCAAPATVFAGAIDPGWA